MGYVWRRTTYLLVTLALGALLCPGARAQQAPSGTSGSTVSMPRYPTELPPGERPVRVAIDFELYDVNEISDELEEFSFTGVLTLSWKDPRQAFDPADTGTREMLYSGNFQFNELSPGWYPQVFVSNAADTLETDNVLYRVLPDGTSTLVQTLSGWVETDLDLRRYPFDAQRLMLRFEVLGYDAGAVVLEAIPRPTRQAVSLPQWRDERVSARVREAGPTYTGTKSQFVVQVDLKRRFVFVLRLVVMPLSLFVVLSWAVFWMERASLGDRLNVSFVGILTVGAYQIFVGELLPHVAYLTLMHTFLNISFWMMCATVVINLVVGEHDKRGKSQQGDLIDSRCRWAFPLVYFLLAFVGAPLFFLTDWFLGP